MNDLARGNAVLFLYEVIEPNLVWMKKVTGKDYSSAEASTMLLAIANQESGLIYRVQINSKGQPYGPATGLWQFEPRGGVAGVMNHPSTSKHAAKCCAVNGTYWERNAIHYALAENDRLATVFARLLLYTDPAPLPAVGDCAGAWDYYLRLWRPGKPDRNRWTALSHPTAWDAVSYSQKDGTPSDGRRP